MSQKNIWKILEIPVTTDIKQIRQAYATKANEVHPEEHPETFNKKRSNRPLPRSRLYFTKKRQPIKNGMHFLITKPSVTSLSVRILSLPLIPLCKRQSPFLCMRSWHYPFSIKTYKIEFMMMRSLFRSYQMNWIVKAKSTVTTSVSIMI